MANKSTYFSTRDEENIAKLRSIIETLPACCNDFFVSIASTTTPLTRLNYATDLRIFFDYLSKRTFRSEHIPPNEITITDLNRLTAKDLSAYLEYLDFYEIDGVKRTNGEKGKARKLSSVRALLKYFFNNDEISANVATKVKQPKIHEKAIIRLDDDEVVRILDKAETGIGLTDQQTAFHEITKERDLAMLTLMLGTGIRVSECVGLDVENLNLDKKEMLVQRKGGNQATLCFSEEIKDSLEKYLNVRNSNDRISPDEHALFVSIQNSRLTVRAVQKLVKKYADSTTTAKNITPHKLRSTYGTSLYKETKDIYLVADVLGHKDVNTTKKHYAAMSEDLKKQAADKVILRKNTL